MHLGLIRGVCGWEAAAFISGLLSVYVCVCVFVLVEEKAKLSVVRRLSFTSWQNIPRSLGLIQSGRGAGSEAEITGSDLHGEKG